MPFDDPEYTELPNDPKYREFENQLIQTIQYEILSKYRILFSFILIASSPIWILTSVVIFDSTLMLLQLTAVATRVSAVVFTLLTHLRESISSIRSNWIQTVLCTDSSIPPVLIPKLEEITTRSPIVSMLLTQHWSKTLSHGFKIGDVVPIFLPGRNFLIGIFGIVSHSLCLLRLISVYAVSVAIRISVKASVIVYAPLIYVSCRPFYRQHLFMYSVDEIRRSPLELVTRTLAVFTFVLIYFKLLLNLNFGAMNSFWQENFSTLFDWYLVPNEFPGWQIASLLTATITWVLYWLADQIERDVRFAIQINSHRRFGFLLLQAIRSSLAIIYIIPCQVWLLVFESGLVQSLRLGRLFPW